MLSCGNSWPGWPPLVLGSGLSQVQIHCKHLESVLTHCKGLETHGQERHHGSVFHQVPVLLFCQEAIPVGAQEPGKLEAVDKFFFRPTPDSSRQVVYQAGKTIALCKFTELMQ